MKTLVVGCSFVENICIKNPTDITHVTNKQKFDLAGTSGAGNQSIAARVIYKCSLEPYQQVVVLWSGVNRLDFPIGVNLHNVQKKNSNGSPAYAYYTHLGQTVWYHSGGYRLSYSGDKCPTFFKEWFTQQYKSASPQYLSELTLLSIIQTQSFLKAKNVSSKMSFIYDVRQDYSKTLIEAGCGTLDVSSPLYNLVDWDQFTSQIPPYEFGKMLNSLEDEFHPTFPTMMNWFKQHMDLDLTA